MHVAQPRTILHICTDPLLRDTIRDIIARQGFRVETAGSLDLGRSLAKSKLYDLLIVNVHGDVPSIMAFCEEVKADNPSQMVAFLAGRWTYFPNHSECPDDVIPKDEGPEGLVRKLHEILGSSHPEVN
jgi:DNA-binding NarL/FixJ family response regulator